MSRAYFSHLSERDLAVVKTVNRYKQVTSKHVEYLHFAGGTDTSRSTRVQRALTRLVRWQQLARLDRPIGGHRSGSTSYIYIPITSKSRIPNPHTLDIADLMVRLYLSDTLVSYEPEPYCHLQVGITKLKPDADTVLQLPDRIRRCFIEVDRGTEFQQKILDKLRCYQSAYEQWEDGAFPAVVFVVLDEDRRRFIERAIRQFGGPPIFRVVTHDDAVDVLTNKEPNVA